MKTISRRTFMRVTGLAALSALAAPVVAFFYPKNLEEVPSEPQLVGELAVGESKTIPFGRYPALVINMPEGLRAYSAVCTHFACLVKWNADSGKIECPCHDGDFDPLDGSVIAGPPPRALRQFYPYVNDADGLIYVAADEDMAHAAEGVEES
jgi:cytochrome b6-f complex iron-sulfur subunit